MQLPPTVNLVLFFSVLPSRMLHTIRPYVASPLLFLGILFSSIKNMVSVLLTLLGMPCASLPISLPKDLPPYLSVLWVDYQVPVLEEFSCGCVKDVPCNFAQKLHWEFPLYQLYWCCRRGRDVHARIDDLLSQGSYL